MGLPPEGPGSVTLVLSAVPTTLRPGSVERTRCGFRHQEASLPGTDDGSTDVLMCWTEAEITACPRSPGAAELAAGLWRRWWRRGLF